MKWIHSSTYPVGTPHRLDSHSVSGLVVKSIVAIDGPRVRFAADARVSRKRTSSPFAPYYVLLFCHGLDSGLAFFLAS